MILKIIRAAVRGTNASASKAYAKISGNLPECPFVLRREAYHFLALNSFANPFRFGIEFRKIYAFRLKSDTCLTGEVLAPRL
jgi:hypothetical protein